MFRVTIYLEKLGQGNRVQPVQYDTIQIYLWPPCIAGCGHIYFHPVVSSFFLSFFNVLA